MTLLPLQQIQTRIYFIRNQKVMLDSDLAQLYGVTTFNLNKALMRNRERFPADFMFRLTGVEYKSLIFQIGISKMGRGGRRHMPYVFTQEGIAMLSGVLQSPRAVQVNTAIMRAFVKLRELLATHKDLAQKFAKLEKKYNRQFKVIFDAIRQMMAPPGPKGEISRRIRPTPKVRGFTAKSV